MWGNGRVEVAEGQEARVGGGNREISEKFPGNLLKITGWSVVRGPVIESCVVNR